MVKLLDAALPLRDNRGLSSWLNQLFPIHGSHTLQNQLMRSLESNDSMFRHFCLRKLWLVTNKSSSLIWRDLAKDSYTEKSPLLRQRSLFKDEFFLAMKSLKDNGYYVFKNRLKQDLIDDFVSLSDTLGFLAEDTRQQISEEITIGQIQNGKSLRYIYNNNVFKHMLVDNLLSGISK